MSRDDETIVGPPYAEERLGETKLLTTGCPRLGCPRRYSIDEGHWDYARVKRALDRGDRSVLVCYHPDLFPASSGLPN